MDYISYANNIASFNLLVTERVSQKWFCRFRAGQFAVQDVFLKDVQRSKFAIGLL